MMPEWGVPELDTQGMPYRVSAPCGCNVKRIVNIEGYPLGKCTAQHCSGHHFGHLTVAEDYLRAAQDGPQTNAAYVVVMNREERLKSWVKDNAKRWGAGESQTFLDLIVALREAAQLEGVALYREKLKHEARG